MTITNDMKDLLLLLHKWNVQYMLVGGVAVITYGYVRTTQDLDLLIYPSEENAEKMMNAMRDFGFGDAGIPIEYFQRENAAVHIGVEPNRIDFLTSLYGVSNDVIFSNMQTVEYCNMTINIISKSDLIAAKKAAGRIKDLADVEELLKIEDEVI